MFRGPTRDDNAILAELAERAFLAVVPCHQFQYRGGENPDYGRDGSLELFSQGIGLNIRVHIQFKGHRTLTVARDGFVHDSVPLNTLAYLMRHLPSAIWVVYGESDRTLVWDWVRDIARTEGFEDDASIAQDARQSITHVFRRQVDEGAFAEIYSRALREYQILGMVRDTLASPGATLSMEVVSEVGDVRTSIEAIRALKRIGVDLANAGLLAEAKKWVRLVPDDEAHRDGELSTVCAYVYFHSGDFALAWPYVRSSPPTAVPPPLAAGRQFLRASLRYAYGFITEEQYAGTLREIEEGASTTALGLGLRLHRLLNESAANIWSPAVDPAQLEEDAADLRTCAAEIQRLPRAPAALLGRSRIALANVDFQVWLRRWIRRKLSRGVQAQNAEAPFRDLEALACDESMPMRVRLDARFSLLWNSAVRVANAGALREPVWQTELAPFPEELLALARASLECGDLQQALKARLLLGEILAAVGQGAEGRAEITAVLTEAEGLGLPLREKARAALEGKGIFGIIDHVRWPTSDAERDAQLLAMAGEHRQIYVQRLREDFGMGPAAAEEAFDAILGDARERTEYCRHLRRSEDLRYECALLGLRSKWPERNRATALGAFKAERCEGCDRRDPQNHATGGPV